MMLTIKLICPRLQQSLYIDSPPVPSSPQSQAPGDTGPPRQARKLNPAAAHFLMRATEKPKPTMQADMENTGKLIEVAECETSFISLLKPTMSSPKMSCLRVL
jgi:hypothetical protein